MDRVMSVRCSARNTKGERASPTLPSTRPPLTSRTSESGAAAPIALCFAEEVHYRCGMTKKTIAKAGLALAFLCLLPACGAKPKQAEAPDALSDKGPDMSGGEDSRNGAILKDDKSGEEQMHAKCCGQCKVAMSKDRTGARSEEHTSELQSLR